MNPERRALIVALCGLAALAVAMGIGRFAFTPVLPMMQGEHGISVAEGGWLASANYAGYLVGGLSALWLRARPGVVIRASLALIAAATLGMGLGDRFWMWMLLRAVAGVSSAWALVFVSTWCLEQFSTARRPVLGSVVFSGVGVGIALAGVLCLMLMQAGADAAQAWLVLGGVAVGLTGLTWRMFGTRPAEGTVQAAVENSPFRWTRDAVLLVVCYGVFGYGYIIPATFVPSMARTIINDPAVFGWSWPLFGLAAMTSTLAAGAFLRAMGNRGVWGIGALVMACGVAAPALSSGIGAVMFAAFSVGGTFMVLTMAGMQEARRVGGVHAKTLMAALTSSFALGQIAGPLVVAWQVRIGGSINAVLVGAAVLLAASAAVIAGSLITERKTDEALSQ